jgi:hypothetical protein
MAAAPTVAQRPTLPGGGSGAARAYGPAQGQGNVHHA